MACTMLGTHLINMLCMLQVLKQLADAQKELSEAVQAAEAEEEAGAANGSASAEQQNGTAAAAAEDDADSDAGFGFEEEAFGAEQVAVARHVRAMLAATVGLVRAVVRQLLAERCVQGWAGRGLPQPAGGLHVESAGQLLPAWWLHHLLPFSGDWVLISSTSPIPVCHAGRGWARRRWRGGSRCCIMSRR